LMPSFSPKFSRSNHFVLFPTTKSSLTLTLPGTRNIFFVSSHPVAPLRALSPSLEAFDLQRLGLTLFGRGFASSLMVVCRELTLELGAPLSLLVTVICLLDPTFQVLLEVRPADLRLLLSGLLDVFSHRQSPFFPQQERQWVFNSRSPLPPHPRAMHQFSPGRDHFF